MGSAKKKGFDWINWEISIPPDISMIQSLFRWVTLYTLEDLQYHYHMNYTAHESIRHFFSHFLCSENKKNTECGRKKKSGHKKYPSQRTPWTIHIDKKKNTSSITDHETTLDSGSLLRIRLFGNLWTSISVVEIKVYKVMVCLVTLFRRLKKLPFNCHIDYNFTNRWKKADLF